MLRANGPNVVCQQLPTLLDVTCCVRLYTLLHVVACCWKVLRKAWNRSNFKLRTNGRNIVGSTWQTMLRPFARGLTQQNSLGGVGGGGGGVVFKNVVERFNYCIVKLQFSNSDFLKQTLWFTNADFWKQTPIFKLRVLKTNFGFQTLIFGKKLPFTTLIYETKLLFSNSEFLKQTLIFEKKFQFSKTKKKTTIFKSNLDVSLKLWNENVAQKS